MMTFFASIGLLIGTFFFPRLTLAMILFWLGHWVLGIIAIVFALVLAL